MARGQSTKIIAMIKWIRTSRLSTFQGILPCSQGHNLALTVWYEPYPLDSGVKAQGPSRTCNESKEEEGWWAGMVLWVRLCCGSYTSCSMPAGCARAALGLRGSAVLQNPGLGSGAVLRNLGLGSGDCREMRGRGGDIAQKRLLASPPRHPPFPAGEKEIQTPMARGRST